MKDDMEMDFSKFDMSDFVDMMKAIRKVGLMDFMKKGMSEPEHSGGMEMKEELPGESSDEFQEFVPTEKEELSDEIGDEMMSPKKKEYTMFSVKSDGPKMDMMEKSKKMSMMKKMMGK